MRRSYYILAAAVLTVSLSLSGCKPKEKIDLDGIHSTESAGNTMEKETMTDPSATEKETTTEASTKMPYEGSSENTKGTNSSEALSVRSKIATEKNGNLSIEYPILSNLRDNALTETVNTLIKEYALKIVTDYGLDKDKDTLSIQCRIISLDRKKAVITYQGSLMVEGSAHPSEVFYTTSLDLNKGTLIGLSDYADPYTMAGYILSDDCVLFKAEDTRSALEYLKSQDIDTLWETLKQCDFNAQKLDGFPQAFSYENQGTIYISVPVPHALGDYVIVRFDPDTK